MLDILCNPTNEGQEIVVAANEYIAGKGDLCTFYELSINEAKEFSNILSKAIKETKSAIKQHSLQTKRRTQYEIHMEKSIRF
jgi:hypothetical protein